MSFSVATWNINSVRLRLPLVTRYLRDTAPDVLCLQETKCPDDAFPAAAFRDLGYPHVAHRGAKGYNGVAVISRVPIIGVDSIGWCGRSDARHLAVRIAAGALGECDIHTLYVPAGGDIPDPIANEKFAHKLQFLDELIAWSQQIAARGSPAILVGDLNVAPYENDVWSHRQLIDVVSHTPIETERLERARIIGGWRDAVRTIRPEPEKLFTWWSYRAADWDVSNRGRRLDHIWLTEGLAGALSGIDIDRAARGWDRPSDHVPVRAIFSA